MVIILYSSRSDNPIHKSFINFDFDVTALHHQSDDTGYFPIPITHTGPMTQWLNFEISAAFFYGYK